MSESNEQEWPLLRHGEDLGRKLRDLFDGHGVSPYGAGWPMRAAMHIAALEERLRLLESGLGGLVRLECAGFNPADRPGPIYLRPDRVVKIFPGISPGTSAVRTLDGDLLSVMGVPDDVMAALRPRRAPG